MSVSGRGIAASLRPLRARVMASLWLLAATVGSCHAAGKAPDPVPVETFFQQPAVLSAHLSPSGRHVALTTSRGSDRVGLLLIELGEKHVVRTLARFDDADVIDFQWVNDERLVFSLGDLQVGSGEDRKAPGLYSVGVDGKRVTLLIRRTGTHPIGDGTLRSDALSWNHVLLSVPQQHDGSRPDDVVVGRLGLEGSVVTLEPMWMSTRSGDTRPMAMPGAPHGAVNWWFDSQGRPRVAATRRDDRITMYWRAEANGRWRRLSEFDQLHPPYWPHVVRNDGSLWVTHPEGSDGVAVLSRFDGDALAPGPALVRAPGFDFAGELLFDRPDAGPLGVRLEGDSGVTAWFDDSMKQLQAAADERLPGRVNEIECRRCGQPDMVAVVRSHSDRDPGRLVLHEAAGGRWQALATVLDGIDPSRMATVDFQRIKARDGRDLPVWLTLPPGGKPAPAVVLVHGGPWVRGGYWQWDPMAQFLASRGYLVINPEFRGSTGYGEAHFQAGFRQWGQAMQDDVADALLWAQAQGLADRRACIAGASYGGYAALMGLVRHPELYRCGVAWAAVTDPFLFLQGSWWRDDNISGHARRYLLPQLVGEAKEDAAMLTAASPLAQADRIRAPLLLAFGEKDRRVPLAHGERLREALEKAGRPPEWVVYPREAHGWREPATQVDFARRMERFLQQNLATDTAR